jgi:N-acetylneuraminic acid mutarotase
MRPWFGSAPKRRLNRLVALVALASSFVALASCGGGSGSAAPVLKSIAVTPNPIPSGVGITNQLVATAIYSNGYTPIVTTSVVWSSSDPSVATVGASTGLVTGVALGSATITATSGSITGNAALTIVAPSWHATGMLALSFDQPLFYHTATLLAGGKVLIAGGFVGNDIIAGAELFDPDANTWSPAASLVTARSMHSATMLSNGQVLVAGGTNVTTDALASAELYDPVANVWSSGGNLENARSQHTATLLPNGKVLVAGGVQAPSGDGNLIGLASSEIYDSVANTWSPAASLATGRYLHSATLLPNGMVLVVGGVQTPSGVNGNGVLIALASAELYDPVADSWSTAGNLATARYQHTATLLPNGQVLVAGGYGYPSQDPLASAEIYDPVANTWSSAASLSAGRARHTATLLSIGQVLVVGGLDDEATVSTAELYDPVANSWSLAASLLFPVMGHAATAMSNGAVLVSGGVQSGVANSELYW